MFCFPTSSLEPIIESHPNSFPLGHHCLRSSGPQFLVVQHHAITRHAITSLESLRVQLLFVVFQSHFNIRWIVFLDYVSYDHDSRSGSSARTFCLSRRLVVQALCLMRDRHEENNTTLQGVKTQIPAGCFLWLSGPIPLSCVAKYYQHGKSNYHWCKRWFVDTLVTRGLDDSNRGRSQVTISRWFLPLLLNPYDAYVTGIASTLPTATGAPDDTPHPRGDRV